MQKKKCKGAQILFFSSITAYTDGEKMSDLRPVQQRCCHLSSLIAVIIYGLDEKYHHDIMKAIDISSVIC